jgi:hypothetical protein
MPRRRTRSCILVMSLRLLMNMMPSPISTGVSRLFWHEFGTRLGAPANRAMFHAAWGQPPRGGTACDVVERLPSTARVASS